MFEEKQNEFQWVEWSAFATWKNSSHVPDDFGVYQVRACVKRNQPTPTHRSCGVDYSGLLYIDEGKLGSRLGLLQYLGVAESKEHHQFIGTFEYYRLNRIADRELTEVRWAVVENCKLAEKELIDAYTRQFRDLPPGNLKLGG